MEWRRFVTYLWNDPRTLINITAENMKQATHFVQVVINVSLSIAVFTLKRLYRYPQKTKPLLTALLLRAQ